jgi:hypothetical protein
LVCDGQKSESFTIVLPERKSETIWEINPIVAEVVAWREGSLAKVH